MQSLSTEIIESQCGAISLSLLSPPPYDCQKEARALFSYGKRSFS